MYISRRPGGTKQVLLINDSRERRQRNAGRSGSPTKKTNSL